ncbi:hypothetical protein D7231_31900 [Streptomyces klenkii]|uniref:Uncharacterized protein n=1 Tax=Streptomyces klenkii TaxID=1420899 RepID=A0A3B0AMJ6_9ACTN|nr:DUF6221 family protein [Streptomyces klenkii]RKN61878.1 hypothetical protein D7231_31900 [Streptomyces klenkii]
MDDLIAFVRARLDEDEAAAQAACEHASASWHVGGLNDPEAADTVLMWPPNPRAAEFERRKGLPVTSDRWDGIQMADIPGLALHIARHDPERVLREIWAKRRVLRDYEDVQRALKVAGPGTPPHDLVSGAANILSQMLHLLALPYADHPDYREEWRLWPPGAIR